MERILGGHSKPDSGRWRRGISGQLSSIALNAVLCGPRYCSASLVGYSTRVKALPPRSKVSFVSSRWCMRPSRELDTTLQGNGKRQSSLRESVVGEVEWALSI
eukprot:11528173-Karenia_brevis.AAC.1